MKYTERTYRLIESWGWFDWWPVERYSQFSRKKTDLFHIIDCIVLTRKGIIGLQICGADFSSHKTKLLYDEEINSRRWLNTPGTRLLLIGWRKLKRGKRRLFYPRIAWITLKKGKLHFHEYPLNKEKKWTAGKY